MKKEKTSLTFVPRMNGGYAMSVFPMLGINFVEVHLSNKLESETPQQIKVLNTHW